MCDAAVGVRTPTGWGLSGWVSDAATSIAVELSLFTPGGEVISPDSEEGGVNYS